MILESCSLFRKSKLCGRDEENEIVINMSLSQPRSFQQGNIHVRDTLKKENKT